MSLRIITIADDFVDHWDLAKRNGFWDLVSNSTLLHPGDDVLFRTTGARGRFVGMGVVSGSVHKLSSTEPHAWSPRDTRKYKYRVPLDRLEDLNPIRISWGELISLGAPGRLNSVTAIPDSARSAVEERLGLGDRDLEEAVRAIAENPQDPVDVHTDSRERVPATVVLRRGQSRFRKALLAAYGGRCALTGTAFEPLLEAAHIARFKGDHTNVVSNGLLLRADIHTLFDLGQLTIDGSGTIHLSPELLAAKEYRDLAGQRVGAPHDPADNPSPEALAAHHATCSAWFTTSSATP